MHELAREIGWRRRHFAARFHEHVGLPPKALARLLRFRRLSGRTLRDYLAARLPDGGGVLG
ncbi:hypothetical protein [Streptoalloteichus hindustanus]|uniref:Helix-turn-helix domain-containing protein n=1 Tax=Streptoalloteichus hindustanus TaxID=2017 RepID=A0A1M5AKU1_STRHI|nr:hypothetical protein [Streptoalloteichus hindustanus]SHF30785.1 hypothetical protein SAMN05444320_103165 [Streptoalloteichus hindustanus]